MRNQDWMDDANCRSVGHDAFYPPDDVGAHKAQVRKASTAVKICGSCFVRSRCLAEGLTEEYGIWGGATVADRERLRRAMPGGKIELEKARLAMLEYLRHDEDQSILPELVAKYDVDMLGFLRVIAFTPNLSGKRFVA
jgi:hypothetical protein